MKPLYLIGGGGHCISVIDCIESQGEYEIKGIFDQQKNVGNDLVGYKIIDTDHNIENYISDKSYFLITVGHLKSNSIRVSIYNNLKKINANFATIIASTAFVSKNAKVESGTVVMHGAIVSGMAVIGENSIINSKALIEHGSKIGRHTHISTNVIINGDVTVGNNVFIGSSATCIQGISISDGNFIKAGTLIKTNL